VKAAVVSSFANPPSYEEFPSPVASDHHGQVVDVIAAGLHPRVRSQANGSHYTSTGALPFVPGIDGVGRGADGKLRYFLLDDTTMGSMAERTVVDIDRSIVLPPHSDPVAVAAAVNPAMASWMALRRRVNAKPGQSVLVLGATGNAGRMAIQIAIRLGADRVVAAARDTARLAEVPALGATDTVRLEDTERLAQAATEVDVVLDFLWGEPAADAMTALITTRPDRGKPLAWVQIGAVAGPTAPIPSAALRSARLRIVGSGQGSLRKRDYLAELPDLVKEINEGQLQINARTVPLSQVGQAWTDDAHTTQRIVITP
jgi:NADPH:quinone reductase-like Zn-dependent oxidoreductase